MCRVDLICGINSPVLSSLCLLSDLFLSIALWGPGIESKHAVIVNQRGKVTLHPVGQSACAVNGSDISEPTPLSQGESMSSQL